MDTPKNICWWEREELVEHFEQRQDIWTSMQDGNLWIRTLENMDNACAIAMIPSKKTGPYRQYGLRVVPGVWSPEESDKYLLHLLEGWTDYRRRIKMQEFLIESLDTEPEKAVLAAIALRRVELEDISMPEEDPEQRGLFDATGAPHVPVPGTLPKELLFRVVGGGWLRLEPHSHEFLCTLSLRGHENYGGGYSCEPLRGHLRPSNGRVDQTAAHLIGITTIDPKPATQEQLELMLEEETTHVQ